MIHAIRTLGAVTLVVYATLPVGAQPRENAPGQSPQAETLSSRQDVLRQKILDAARRLKAIDRQRNAPVTEGAAPVPGPSLQDRNAVAAELESWKRAQARFDAETICGPLDDSVHVERYAGNLGPTKAFVNQHQARVAQVQWHQDLSQRLGSGSDPGNVNGVRWCTGTMISESMFLTAGHCFDPDSNGWRTPQRGGSPLKPDQLAPLMRLNFGYQLPPAGDSPREAITYPITRLVEHRLGDLDYAIVEVGRGADGELPGKRFGMATPNSTQAVLDSAQMLTIIQHPLGNPKKVAAGKGIGLSPPYLTYTDVDTQGGASGSGVLDHRGNLVAVHVLGGCSLNDGANQAVTLNAIRAYSPYFKSLP